MIFCLEGASAVGKTTMARSLARSLGLQVVPEVNELFVRPVPEPSLWYLECQVERWNIAQEHHSILDGDPLQPLWYNWIYSRDCLQSLDVLVKFYRPLFESRRMRFPDCYLVLAASESTLAKRKEQDTTRRRSNFQKHLQLIEPQKKYFGSMKTFANHRVVFQSAEKSPEEIEVEFERVVKSMASESSSDLLLFDKMISWLRSHSPTDAALF